LLLKLTNTKVQISIVFTLINSIFFFNQSFFLFIVLLSIFIISLKQFSKETQKLFLEAYVFTSIFSLILPSKLPFADGQQDYYEYLFVNKLGISSFSYASNYDYLGFHLIAKGLLFNGELSNLIVGLFFVNLLGFYSLFKFYKVAFNNMNVFLMKTILLAVIFIANLPTELYSYIGFSKLLINGVAGFSSFGLRILAPASFFLMIFYPLSDLMYKKEKRFIVSSIFISLFHYYMFFIFLIAYLAYLNTKLKTNFLIYYLLAGIFSLVALNQLNFFQNLNILFSQMGTRIIHFNLIPVFSIGTILNSGLNNNFIYYFNFETFQIYKPEYLTLGYSPTVGVFNKEVSIPIEKILLLFFCIKFVKNKTGLKFVYNFLLLSTITYLITHIFFSLGYFQFLGLATPWRVVHSISILCLLLICSKIGLSINAKYKKNTNLLTYSLLLVIPFSIFIWKSYNPLEQSYNMSLKNKIIETEINNQTILIPIEETNYSYHYGFPNIYVSLFPSWDFVYIKNLLFTEYFKRVEHHNNIYLLKDCIEVDRYIKQNDINISYIFYSNQDFQVFDNCELSYIKYDEKT